MENIPLPSKIEFLDGQKANEAVLSIQPCHPGYGITLGNALRRVLMSSLPGAAVTGFKIKGVNHEFSAIPNVKEDIVEVSLNLKQLRLKVFTDEPVRLELKAKGEKKVTAKDIKKSSDVEIVNPDLLIATLTSDSAELDMEIIVTRGRGYVATESREKENAEVDLVIIDSIFTPMRNVGIHVENVRVGQFTNYENLLLTIETDGSITPKEAVEQSTAVLIEHFNFIADNVASTKKAEKAKVEEKEAEEDEDEDEEVEDEDNEKKEKKEKKAKKPKKEKK
ncbi:MAG: DNA-directed RNA polymerase subunit alpha [Candidatus Buchananbacteria bacterium]